MADYEKEFQKNPAACGEPFPEFATFFRTQVDSAMDVLDLGCGQGRDALVAARVGCRVVGVDISPTGVRQMEEAAAVEQLDVVGIVADVTTYVPEQSFDVVVLDRVLHQIRDAELRLNVLAVAAGAVRRGGYLLVADTPKNLPSIDSFVEDLKPAWSLASGQRSGCRIYRAALVAA